MKSEEIVIEDLCNKYSKIGYIAYDDIIEYSSKNNLTNIHIEYIQNVLIHRGVIINNDSELIAQKPQSTISPTNMTEKPEKIAINYLYILFKRKGYVSEDDIFNVCDELNLSFSKIDYIGNQILAKGVLISDGLTSAETTSLQEPITYNEKSRK